jgi:ABC transporter substrate binding protein (PQQ-dependent alcohol dehydrogenase system)
MPVLPQPDRVRRALVCGAAACVALPVGAQQRVFPLGFLSQADDERYGQQVLQKGIPDAPGGRSAAAAQVALEDSAFALQGAGWSSSRLVPVESPDASGLPNALQQLLQQGIRHVVLELPAAGVAAVAAAARGREVILFNAAAPDDALRGAQCAANLLHTLPSHAMQADAIAQLLAARKWNRPLVLHGTGAADRLLLLAFQRSARRFGVKPVAERPFKLSNDPRERDLGNVRLLTSDRDYDAVVVLDAQGEFARDLPYRAVLPRPVLGSGGLVAQAWRAATNGRRGWPRVPRPKWPVSTPRRESRSSCRR